MIRIAVDCRKVSDGGIGTYIRNLLRCWSGQGYNAEFYLFCLSSDLTIIEGYKNTFKIIVHDYPKYSLRELFSFEKPLKKYNIDLFFCPHYTLPFGIPCKSIVTIHDLIHLRMPVKGGIFGRTYAKFMLSGAIRRSSLVLTVSEFSKNDIADIYPSSATKIQMVPNGVDGSVFKPLSPDRVNGFRKRLSLYDRFLLYVGALKNHKNPEALAAAANETGLPLVVASGDNGLFEADILPRVRTKSLVKLIEIRSDLEMALLYNCAELLVFPSFYEGFGLPPLEAMACGLPVICSDRTSLPEVCGDAALMFSPDDIPDMLQKIELCLNDAPTRATLREKGLKNAERFSWDDCAKKIFDLIEEAAAK